VQEPRETDAHGPTDPAERDAFAQQVLDPSALLGRNALVYRVPGKLALARFALMVLFAMTGMTIFFVPL
jgi:hypothetical protein